jgi:type I restriction enzyme S subunit
MIEGLKPYAEYKESGHRWLGSVPNHWSVLPNRALFDEVKDRNHPKEEMLSVTITRGIVRQKALLDGSSKKDSSNLNKGAYKLVQPHDIAYNKMRAWQGALGASTLRGIISPAYVVMRPRKEANPWFYHNLYRTPSFAKEAERWSYGITSDMWSLRPEHFKVIGSVLPPPDEQAAIVRFLDHANRKIDGFIRAKRKLIGLLNEQKQAIIHRAVTRGLHPDAPLKPSGIPWFGEIPTHWEVRRLKSHLARNDGGVWGSTFDDKGTIVLRSTEQAMDGSWRIKNPAMIRLTTTQIASALLLEGDIVVTKSSGSQNHIGKASLVTSEIASLKCCYSNFMQRLRTTAALSPNYLAMFLNSRTGRVHYQFTSTSTTGLGNLTRDTLANLPMPMPVRSEQEKILNSVDLELKPLNTAIARTEREIALMQEYRTRLTADLVTGKLDVRVAATQLPDEPPLKTTPDDAELVDEAETADEETAL